MMDYYGEVNAATKPPIGKRMKSRAPAPPQVPEPAPRRIFRNAVPDGGGTGGIDAKENVLRPTVDIHLTTPQGYQTTITEDGSKALMDLLVELCSRYHLNPALHTLELLSPEGHPLGFKPNVLLGSLDVACVLIREKVWEEKVLRRPAPKVPEKTVRLVVNYHRSQKAVFRVNPLVPLQSLVPVICDKCDFEPARILLLKDSVSHHELPLDKSLTQLGIKELYVLDKSLDSIRSSTPSLGGTEKKGLLGIFKFNRRKSKTEEAAMDMDGTDDNVTQNTDTHSNGLSTVSIVPCVEDRPSTLGQSQSVMNISRMSPKAEPKKRRAPVPPGVSTPTLEHYTMESYQMGLGSESQQRKRKAPAPPPTPSSETPGLDDTSTTSAAPTPDIPAIETPIPAFRTKVVSPTVNVTTNPVTTKIVVQPTPASPATPIPSSPAPSSTTADSLAIQDSSSELSHSIEDSDVDLDQAGSLCSTSSDSTLGVSAPKQAQPITTSSTRSSMMDQSEQASSTADQSDREAALAISSGSETESALNLRLEEKESNRHSGIGDTDRPAPPKPQRSPAREPPQLVFPPPPASPPPSSPSSPPPTDTGSPQSPMDEEPPQSWLHSLQRSVSGGQTPDTNRPEEETLSVGSSGGSLPDQGYAPSEGMAEGEDSGMVSSPSDTMPTSPDGSLSLDGSSGGGGGGGGGGGRQPGPMRDNSSDSDEGCATWGSRHSDITSKERSGRLKGSYEEDPELTAQLNQTLAEFEADLADISHMDISVRESPYTLSTDSNEVPVSVVDMDIPVTAIDEVLEEYGQTMTTGSKGLSLSRQYSGEAQNKNNNASTTESNKKSRTANTQQPPQAAQRGASLENKSTHGIVKEEKQTTVAVTKTEENNTTYNTVIEQTQTITAVKKTNVKEHKARESATIQPASVKSNTLTVPGKKPNPPLANQRSASTEEEESTERPASTEEISVYRVHNSSTTSSHSKITHSPTSRFGMKTFTVVPPKPSVSHAAKEKPAITLTVGAIKIDEFGNMVKAGISRNKFGGSFESGINQGEASPLLGKAKAFWSSTERQDGSPVACSRGSDEKVKESTDSLKTTHSTVSETTARTNKIEGLNVAQVTACDPTEKAKPKETVKESVKEVIDVAKEERVEVESKVVVSEPTHQPSSKPPLLQDQKRDLSFLKPSRRTSSQYVAYAIAKYTPKTSAKPDNIPESSAPLKTGNFSFQRGGRSILVNPHQASQSSASGNKISSGSVSHPLGPKRSMSFPEYISETKTGPEEVRRDKGDFVSSYLSIGGSSKSSIDTNNTKHIRPSSPIRVHVTTTDNNADIKHTLPRSPSPSKATTVQSPPSQPLAKQVPAFKTASKDHTSNKEMTTTAVRPALAKKPESGGGVLPEPQQVTVFGPVKKFRPVICKSIQKETSLHSSLMEAIQTGGGKGRLKKTSSSEPSSLKTPAYAEEENERSGLLAAIKAQSSTGQLKKTKSEAAEELESFRKTASQESSVAPRGPPSFPCPSTPPSFPPAFAPPPSPHKDVVPPPPPMGPPPPPPVHAPAQAKPSVAVRTGGTTQMNPALAREAMLEAIRSGSAVERLKKVAAPTKTVQVNGRLGTIQATSSTLTQQ